MSERRQPGVRGGRRAAAPPPLSTRECADVMGVATSYVRAEIEAGVLKAEKVDRPGRRAFYRVHEADFLDYLTRIKWSRMPTWRTGTD